VGHIPQGTGVTPDGKTVIVVNSGSNTVSIVNAGTNAVTTTVTVGTRPLSLGNFIASVISACPVNVLASQPVVDSSILKNIPGGYLRYYPNPVINTANIEFNAMQEGKYEAQVINATGQVMTVKSGFAIKGLNVISFDMSSYAPAVYYVRLINKEHGVQIIKFVKAQ
jgi:YVTN family beta-propeller protein